MNTINEEKDHLRTKSLVALLLLLVLVVSMNASLAHADTTKMAKLSFTADVRHGNTLIVKTGIKGLASGIKSVQFQVQVWYSPNITETDQSLIYSSAATDDSVRSHKAAKNFNAPYPGPGDYFISILAFNPLDGSLIANIGGNPFSNVSFIANLSTDGTTLQLQVSKTKLNHRVDSVSFVVNASLGLLDDNDTGYTLFWTGGGITQESGGTATLNLNVPYQGAGDYFFEVYVYNAADGTCLGSALGDPREGTGG
jgi:hypothetical protein